MSDLLRVERGAVKLLNQLPPKSIALDGYVQGPELDLENERISMDHHAGCIRLFTSATCKQVLDAILLGFDPTGYTIWINDVDGDTALATWLLLNPKKVQDQKVRTLVDVVAAMDAHGPAYPPVSNGLVEVFYDYIMAPERDARFNKTYGTCDLDDLLRTCMTRISDWYYERQLGVGTKKSEPPVLITKQGVAGIPWVLGTCEGFGFGRLYKDGHVAGVLYQELPDGSYLYTIARKSDLVLGFPVGPHTQPGTILYELNRVEPGWGGGSSIGGAPRNADGSRSKLKPIQVYDIVELVLRGENS